MTMMYNDEREHPDEGTIHAWLDGALSADESERFENHVKTCPACEAAVAEARGLIAGASRVLTELDEVPQPTLRPYLKSDVPHGSLWRSLRITPARAAVAAVLLVAVGSVLTSRRGVDVDSLRDSVVAKVAVAPEQTNVEPATPTKADSSTLLGMTKPVVGMPPRVIARAKTPGVVVPPAESIATAKTAAADLAASNQVAQARQAIAATRDTLAGRSADRTAVAGAVQAPAAPVPVPTEVGARAAESRMRLSTVGVTSAVQPGCYRVAAAEGGGSWGDAKLPFIIALDSAGGGVGRVLTTKGEDTESRAVVTRLNADSLSFRLRRIGFTGSLDLGGLGPTRRGFAQSKKAENSSQSITVTATSVACPTP
jgi:hypothetical protein